MSFDDFPCREAVTIVTDWFEGALPSGERAVLERHLAWCAGCTTYVDQLRDTVRLTGRLREQDVPAPVMDVLVAAFREARGG
jgi:hypothetical protein